MKKARPYIITSVIALISTVIYTGDLELGWVIANWAVPFWGLIVGVFVGAFLKTAQVKLDSLE